MIPELIKQKIEDEAKRYSEEKHISIKDVKSLHGKTQLYYASLHGAEFGFSLLQQAAPIQEESEDEVRLWMEAYAMLDHFGEQETMKHFTIKRKV